MITNIEYALLAGAAYYDTRTAINRFPLPAGWSLYSRDSQDESTGFEASTYKKCTEIVISFAGTDDKRGRAEKRSAFRHKRGWSCYLGMGRLE